MAFNSTVITGNGVSQNIIVNTNILESVVTSMVATNTTGTAQVVDVLINSAVYMSVTVPANDKLVVGDKLNVPVSQTMAITAPVGVTVAISYMTQAIDTAAALNLVQSTIATLDSGTINDTVIGTTSTWSSDKIMDELTTIPQVTVNNTLTSTSTTEALSAAQGKVLQDSKQTTLVSGTNVKTIGDISILGSGNIPVVTSLPNLYRNKVTFTASNTFIVPDGVSSVRAYVVGRGGSSISGNRSSTANDVNLRATGGAGGGMAWGDISVTSGDSLELVFGSGVAKLIKNTVVLLQGNPGQNGATTLSITYPVNAVGGTATKDVSVTNGGTCNGGNSSQRSGGGAGIPTMTPIGSGSALNIKARPFNQRFTDPLLSDANGASAVKFYLSTFDGGVGVFETARPTNGGGGGGVLSSVNGSNPNINGIDGADFGGGSCADGYSTIPSSSFRAGAGGFLAAGGFASGANVYTTGASSCYGVAGAGGYGAGAGGGELSAISSSTFQRTVTFDGRNGGAACIVLMY